MRPARSPELRRARPATDRDKTDQDRTVDCGPSPSFTETPTMTVTNTRMPALTDPRHVRRSRIGRALLPLLLLALLPGPVAAQGQGPAPVTVAPVVKRKITRRRSFVGTSRAPRRSLVSSPVDGMVDERLARAGDRVKKDQVLYQLRTARLKIEIEAAKSELALRSRELEELKNGSRPEEIEQADARLKAAIAGRDYWRGQLKRAKSLLDKGVAPREEYQLTRQSARRSEEELREARAALALVKKGPRAERIAVAGRRVEIQKRTIELLQDTLRKKTIRAPFDGYVVREAVEVGQWVVPGTTVMEVIHLDTIEVEVQVLEDDVTGVRLGGAAKVTFGALPGRTFKGTVARVVPDGDTRARTFPVRIEVENKIDDKGSPLLKAGLFSRVELALGHSRESLMVSKDALVLGGPQTSVLVLREGKDGGYVVAPVPVTVGLSDGGAVAVEGGLAPGDLVVVGGNERLRPGQAVAISKRLNVEAKLVEPERTVEKAGRNDLGGEDGAKDSRPEDSRPEDSKPKDSGSEDSE